MFSLEQLWQRGHILFPCESCLYPAVMEKFRKLSTCTPFLVLFRSERSVFQPRLASSIHLSFCSGTQQRGSILKPGGLLEKLGRCLPSPCVSFLWRLPLCPQGQCAELHTGSGHLLALSPALASSSLGAHVSGPPPTNGPSFQFQSQVT